MRFFQSAALLSLLTFAFGFSACQHGATTTNEPVADSVATQSAAANPAQPATPTTEKTNEISESIEKVKIGATEVMIAVSKTAIPYPIYFRPHEDEFTSVAATRNMLLRYGGTFVELKQKGARKIQFESNNRLYGFDPNRIFTAVGIKRTLEQNSQYEATAEQAITKFSNKLLNDYVKGKPLVVAVHNNSDQEPLTIHTYENNDEALNVFVNPQHDEDDFFYVTNPAHFKYLKEKGYNVVLQNTVTVRDDGSLSVFCGNNRIDYINVECEQGHLPQQIEMMQAVQGLVRLAQ